MRNRIIELVTYAVMLLLLVGGGGWALVTWGPNLACQHLALLCPPAPGEQELAPFVEGYLTAAGVGTDAENYTLGVAYLPPPNRQPYRVGRVAVVNVEDRAIDGKLTRALPADFVATRPGEVGTVIWVRWGETLEGTYHREGVGSESGKGYRGYCAVVVIDLAAGEIVGQAYYQALSPPETTTGSGDVHTQLDVQLVANWLTSLPVGAPPSPSPSPRPELSPVKSLTLNGIEDSTQNLRPVPDEAFYLGPGEYDIVFSGEATKACPNCYLTVQLWGVDTYDLDYQMDVIDDLSPDIKVGPWEFSGHQTVEDWQAGSYQFVLTMPDGPWSLTITRVE